MTPAVRASESSSPATVVDFSGYSWWVKSSSGKVGPGPNVFSSDRANVRVDGTGALRLAIVERAGTWTCAEVVLTHSLGYGTYRWVVEGDVSRLPAEVVLGLFTWSDDPAHAHREIDVEFSRWGDPAVLRNGWHSIQTGRFPNPLRSNFGLRPAQSSVHTITWAPGRVTFRSEADGVASTWAHAGPEVPVPGDETPRMNLWLYQGRAPSSGPRTVVVRAFAFRAL